MFSKYYQNELQKLKESGKEFAKTHPVLAPMLSGASADADVERLLEGVAFLTANINRKLDDELPEVLHLLMQMICPHFMRPVPSATIIKFTPKDNLNENICIPSGTNIDSAPVDDTMCRFRTCFDVDVSPLSIEKTELIERRTAGPNIDQVEIKLNFKLNAMTLADWSLEKLRFYLGGDYSGACDLYFLLCHYLKEIKISGNAASAHLGNNKLSPAGFGLHDTLLPYPSNIFPSFRVIQEYFLFQEKFLFLDLDLTSWKERGKSTNFTITFICSLPPFNLPKINKQRFTLFAVPAVNLFTRDAAPIMFEHHKMEACVHAEGMRKGTYQIYSIDKVSGFPRGSLEKREFIPFSEYIPEVNTGPVYHSVFRPSITEKGYDVYLSLAYPPDEFLPEAEIVSSQLTCTNGTLPDLLQTEEICRPTSNTPELVTYRNILPPSASQVPPLGGDLLWYLLSHLSMNLLSIASADNLKKLLQFYLFPGERDKPKEISNKRRISSISSVKINPHERLFKGTVLRGQAIVIKTRQDHFAGPGDMYLFGSVLDYFLGTYASINTYTSLTFEDIINGEHITWPVRLGIRPLI